MQSKFVLKKFGLAGLKIFALSLILSTISTAAFSQVRESKQLTAPAADHKKSVKSEAERLQLKISGGSDQVYPVDAKGNSLGPAPASIFGFRGGSSNGFNVVDPNSRAFIYNGGGPFQLRSHALATPATLTALGGTVIFGFPGAMALNTMNQKMYVVDQASPFGLYFVDTITGGRFLIKNLTGVPQANLTGIAFDPTSGVLYGISSSITVSQIFTINVTTGVCTPIGAPSALVAGGIQLNAAPGGSLFTVDIVTDALYKWNKSTGVPTLVGPLGVDANFGQDGHFDMGDGQYYWAAVGNGLPAQLRVIDTTNGSSTQIGLYPSQSSTLGIYAKPTVACTGTPAPVIVTTDTSVCPNQVYALSIQNPTPGTGVTYQWQSGPSATGPWTNVGPNSHQYALTAPAVPATTFYRVVATCGANSGNSNAVKVAAGIGTQCYCNAGATSTSFEKISRVTFANINRASTATAGYENFLTDTARVIRQATYPITVTISGAFSSDQVLVWIDFNQNGDFTDAGELVYTSATGVGPHTGNITIPITALLGNTRMRVRMHDSSLGPNATPCGNSTYGQVEDYTVNIAPCIPTSITVDPTSKTVTCGTGTFFRIAKTGSLPTVEWQYRTPTTAPGLWLVVPNAAPYSGVTSDTLDISTTTSAMSGWMFRALVGGACAARTPSAAATLTVANLVPVVNPASATICTGTIQKLTLSNVDSPVPVTGTFTKTSGKLITDNSQIGIKDTLAVTLPAGIGSITRVALKVNIPHTWPGDLVFVLQAPSGQRVNLNWFLTGTGNGPGTGYTNAVITSDPAVTRTLGSGSASPVGGAPFTWDGVTGAANPPPGPTGFLPTTASYSALFPNSNVSGNWVLAVYDGFGGDVGTLTNWSLDITYLQGTPSKGIWSANGTNATIFTDAAATVPYTGTQQNEVWVRPTASTNYKVYIPNGSCSSDTTTVPVTVSTPATAVSAVANKAICVGTNTTFSSVVTGGANTVLQWQVSTDGGATYTNLANGGVYSGATTNTLTITGATTMMNNYLYRLSVSAAPCASTTTLTSAAGRLTVNPTPVIVVSAAPVTKLFPGLTTTLTANVTPNAAATYAWYRNGVLVPGASARTLVVNINQLGSYYARVTDVNTCSGQSNTVVISDSSNDRLFIYPNPNNGMFQIRYYRDPNTNTADNFDRVVNIFDSKGARIYSKRMAIVGPYTMMSVDLSNLGKGVYHVDVVTSSGERLKTGSVLVQY